MDDILARFVAQAPVAVLVRATLAHCFADTTLDALFDRVASAGYTRDLTSAALVRETAAALQGVLGHLRPAPRAPIAGLRLRSLDGNFLAGTEHRLGDLRGCSRAGRPGGARCRPGSCRPRSAGAGRRWAPAARAGGGPGPP